MKKIYFAIVIIITFLGENALQAQVEFSNAFKKTIEKIIKDRVKQGVINWLTEEEPVIGIIGRDLIGQVINSSEKNELIRSVTNVVTSSIFIYNVQDILKKSFPDSTYNRILQEAKKFGWDEKKLIAYSSLYFYYSERIKFNLYISPYIFEMEDVKHNIESLKINKSNKWVTEISKVLVRKRRKEKNITLDVRLLEVLQVSLLSRINSVEKVQIDSSLVIKLIKDYSAVQGDNLYQLIDYLKGGNVKESLPILFQLFTKSINSEINKKVSKDGYAALPFDLKVMKDLLSNYFYLVNSPYEGLFNSRKFESNMIRTTTQLINTWISKYNVNQFRFDYGFMLASSYVNKSEELRFIVLDQLRLGYFKKDWSLFLFISGILDPLLQEALESNIKVYLAGLGSSYLRFNLSIGAGIPYDDLKLKNVKLAVSLGYEIPILEITENF